MSEEPPTVPEAANPAPRSQRWRGKAVPGASMAKKGIILGVFGILVSVPLLIIASDSRGARESMLIASCQNNLKSIGASLQHYADEHDGKLPDKLSELYPVYLDNGNTLVCSKSGNAAGDAAGIDAWSDYVLVPGLRVSGMPADADVLVCYDKVSTWHIPSARNELYLDGHVEFHRLK